MECTSHTVCMTLPALIASGSISALLHCRRMQQNKLVQQEEQALAQAETVRRITREMRKNTASQTCGVCFEEFCELDGIYCLNKMHFTCDECFTNHVKSQSELADDFNPYQAGDVWCVYKPMENDGCECQQPFTPKACPPCTPLPLTPIDILWVPHFLTNRIPTFLLLHCL